jgi:enoyl-CoA hydratase
VGKSKAMEMCIANRQMGAQEAEQAGLVARILPVEGMAAFAKKRSARFEHKLIGP